MPPKYRLNSFTVYNLEKVRSIEFGGCSLFLAGAWKRGAGFSIFRGVGTWGYEFGGHNIPGARS